MTSPPVVADGVVFVVPRRTVETKEEYVDVTAGEKLHAVNATTGEVKWTYLAEGRDIVESGPTVADGVVFVGDNSVMVDKRTCFTCGDGEFYTTVPSSHAYEDNWELVSATPNAGRLHALDAATGSAKWTYQTDSRVNSRPAVKESAPAHSYF